MSSSEAQYLLQHLTELVIPNLTKMPAFNPKELLHFYKTLGYPYPIRQDAITAIGAPNSIGFLVRAFYWLYLVTRNFFRQGVPGAIPELSDE